MTYAELFARVGALVPLDDSYAIEVQTFRHSYYDRSSAVKTRWTISVLPRDSNGCSRHDGETPEAALAALIATLPSASADQTSVSDLVGDPRACDPDVARVAERFALCMAGVS